MPDQELSPALKAENDQTAARARDDLDRHVESTAATLAEAPDEISALAAIATTLIEAEEAMPRNRLASLLAVALVRLERLERENAEYRELFDMQWRRMTQATDRWRAEDPQARALVMPDLGALLKWLMDEADKARMQPS